MDYREIPAEFEKAFDAFVSVEMLEVGLTEFISSNLSTDSSARSMLELNIMISTSSLSTLRSSLKTQLPSSLPPLSLSLNSPVTSKWERLFSTHFPSPCPLHRAEDFMRKYMWPNSCLPSATALITAAQKGSQGRFNLDGVENHAAREYNYINAHSKSLFSTAFPTRLPTHPSRMGPTARFQPD
jgi:cyclopropane-fatty-acyl-phospholipid synthase